MFSNNYKAIFDLLGGNQIFNNFNESTIEENKTEILAKQPAKFEYLTEFKGEDESGLEERLRRINSVCSFTIQTAKAQTTMRDSVTAKTITVKHLVYRAMDRTTGLQFDFKAEFAILDLLGKVAKCSAADLLGGATQADQSLYRQQSSH